jgi:hypothetical protein
VIATLDDQPNDVGGLTAAQLKAKFDEAPTALKDFFNDTTKPEIDTHLASAVTDVGGVHGLNVTSGTFTPVIAGSSVAGVQSYTTQTGYYTKIGNRVFVEIFIVLSSVDGTISGGIVLKGLPFASKIDATYRGIIPISYFANLDLPASQPYVSGLIMNNSSQIALRVSGDNTVNSAMSVAQLTATTTLLLSGSYET